MGLLSTLYITPRYTVISTGNYTHRLLAGVTISDRVVWVKGKGFRVFSQFVITHFFIVLF